MGLVVGKPESMDIRMNVLMALLVFILQQDEVLEEEDRLEEEGKEEQTKQERTEKVSKLASVKISLHIIFFSPMDVAYLPSAACHAFQ